MSLYFSKGIVEPTSLDSADCHIFGEVALHLDQRVRPS